MALAELPNRSVGQWQGRARAPRQQHHAVQQARNIRRARGECVPGLDRFARVNFG